MPRKALLGPYLSKSKEHPKSSRQQENCADNIWQCIWIVFEELDMAKVLWITTSRVCKKSAEDRPNDHTDIEAHREQQKSSRLVSGLIVSLRFQM